jgi:hypothetical protein
MRWRGLIAALVLLLPLAAACGAHATTLQQIGPSFAQPVYVTSDPGNADRLFVVEREGTIRLVENGVATLFADISSKVRCCEGERGLLSIALDPEFGASGRLYVDYTGKEKPGEIHVAEMIAAADRRSASAATLKDLFTIEHSALPSHNGGQLQFGPDRHLYVSTGDGGGSNDQLHNAQNPVSRLGKILRVDPDDPGAAEIWSLGLRNPFRFSFDSLRGDMVIGDVGQGLREEVDFAPAPLAGVVGGQGANYGWNCREGLLAGPASDPECVTPPAAGFVDPVFDYAHAADPDLPGSDRCAITAGYVARDAGLGALYGRYVYADYCAGVLRSLQLPSGAGGEASGDCSLGLRLDRPVSFGEDAARRLYVVEQGGRVYRLAGPPPADCPPLVLAPTAAKPTYIGIKAQRRRVERGKAALLTVFVSPCVGRKGESVALLRNGGPNGSKFLNRACTTHFLRRVRRGTTFAAFTREERGFQPGKSRKLRIRIAPRHRSR